MVGLLVIFGIAHSGLAALRPAGESHSFDIRANELGWSLMACELTLMR